MIKKAGLLNMIGMAFGYHNTNKISDEVGIDRRQGNYMYHSMMVPNSMLYSHEDVVKDFKEFRKTWKDVNPDEKKYIKKRDQLFQKYKDIKSGKIKMKFDKV